MSEQFILLAATKGNVIQFRSLLSAGARVIVEKRVDFLYKYEISLVLKAKFIT
jgi:hypothetical protein